MCYTNCIVHVATDYFKIYSQTPEMIIFSLYSMNIMVICFPLFYNHILLKFYLLHGNFMCILFYYPSRVMYSSKINMDNMCIYCFHIFTDTLRQGIFFSSVWL